MTRGRTPNKDGWITVGVKLRLSDVQRLDAARGVIHRSEWIRKLVLGDLSAREAPDASPVERAALRDPAVRQAVENAKQARAEGLAAREREWCPHPKARRSKGGLCMACGQNVT